MSANQSKWQSECQPFELDFHRKENYRWDKLAFNSAWAKHFAEWCMLTTDFTNQVVLDIGCGSRPAIDFFVNAIRYYNDPLIDQYKEIEQVKDAWADIPADRTFSKPAEEYWPVVEGACSFINVWNILDHVFDWRCVLDNLISYCKQGCIVSFGTDIAPHKGHMGIDNPIELYDRIKAEFDIVKDCPGYWNRHIALLLVKK